MTCESCAEEVAVLYVHQNRELCAECVATYDMDPCTLDSIEAPAADEEPPF